MAFFTPVAYAAIAASLLAVGKFTHPMFWAPLLLNAISSPAM
jgi:hypothetical protein